MLDRTRVLVTIAACMSATAVAAQAPAPTMTAFEGTYAGVSRTFEGEINAVTRGAGSITPACVPNGQPGPCMTHMAAESTPRSTGAVPSQAEPPATAATTWSGRRRASEPYAPSRRAMKTTAASRLP
jgi:hypothetical protein